MAHKNEFFGLKDNFLYLWSTEVTVESFKKARLKHKTIYLRTIVGITID